MPSYADYSFYEVNIGSQLDEEEFERLAVKASRFIDRITFDRASEVADELVKESIALAVCEIVEYLNKSKQVDVDGTPVKSVSNGGYSVTYALSEDGRDKERMMYTIAELYIPAWLLSFDLR